MAREHAIIFEENFEIPLHALTFEGFRRWVHSPEFPETGRIDFLDGDIEVDMSPEDLHTHGIVKVAITHTLHGLVAGRLGEVFSDRTRVVSRFAPLSAEPDVVVVLWKSLQEGRVRYVPAASGEPGRYVEMEGAPDLVVEVVSDSSQRKDTKKLPPLYAGAGVPELWIADTRGREIRFQIHALDNGTYVPVESNAADTEGWMRSPRLGLAFRLTRHSTPVSTWYYVLEHREG
ncbi:MAG: Uma2 family endonuclease [Thermoanaerobaculia bacterium]